MLIRIEKIKILYAFIFSIIFSIIPWENIRNSPFLDREVYLNYAKYGLNILDYKSFDTVFSYVFNEWLWHLIIKNINNYISFELFFGFISFSIIFCMSLFLVRKVSFMAPFLLLNPLVIDLAFSQYRICLALVFLSIAFILKNKKFLQILFLIAATLTHTSIIIFIIIYSLIILSNKLISNKIIYIYVLLFLGLLLSFLLSDYVSEVLAYFGDRRDYSDVERISSSFLYLFFWIISFFMLLHYNIKNNSFSFYQKYSLLILSMIAGNLIFGGYSTRFLAISFPFIMKAYCETNFKFRAFIFILYFTYLISQWFFWLK